MKKRILISLIVFLIVLLVTIGLYISKNIQKVNYTMVDCTVVSAEKEVKRFMWSQYFKTIVFVYYEGNEYKLQNPERTYYEYIYPKNKQIKAYLYKEKLYASLRSVREDTITTKIYFLFLFMSGIFAIILLTNIVIYNKKKRRNGK